MASDTHGIYAHEEIALLKARVKELEDELTAAKEREEALRDALETISFMSMSIAPAMHGSETSFYKKQAYSAIGTAARALEAKP